MSSLSEYLHFNVKFLIYCELLTMYINVDIACCPVSLKMKHFQLALWYLELLYLAKVAARILHIYVIATTSAQIINMLLLHKSSLTSKTA